MGTNDHARERVKHGATSPPPGRDRGTDRDHALQAGKAGTTARKSAPFEEGKTRDKGRDDRRSGSDSDRH
jgi:hypothetical protein